MIVVTSGPQWFGRVESPRTHVKLHHRSGSVLCYGSNRFGRVEPPRTHEKLPYDPCSLWSSVVPGGSVGLNYPELMRNYSVVRGGSVGLNHPDLMSRNYPMILVPSGAQWFGMV